MDQRTPVKKKSNFRYKIVSIGLIGLSLFGLARVYYRMTDDFRLSNISYEMPFQENWEVAPMTAQEQQRFDEILKQKFYYIGKGAQSYAFRSGDDQYVLKFFKFKHLKPSVFVNILPEIGPLKEYKQNQIERKNRLLNSVFDGYRLAYAVHADETGLIYIHLNKTQSMHKNVIVQDKIGLEKTISLDDVPFILQVKVKTTRAVMTELMKTRDIPKVKERIAQIFNLYLSEYSKGIYDRDHGVMHNTGFAGDKPVHLDVGKLTKDERMKDKEYYKPDLLRIVAKFNVWFKANYPKDYPQLSAFMDEQMNQIFGGL